MFKKGGKLVKFLTKTLAGRIIDKAVLGGVVNTTVQPTIRTESGEIDIKEIVVEILTSTLPILLVVSLIFGWLDLETVKELAKTLLP